MAYLDIDGFKLLTLMPGVHVDAIETVSPGWVDAQLEQVSSWIDSRLRKRYAVPFVEPYPSAVTGWLARIVTVRCYLKRGVDSTDEQFVVIKQDADAAAEEIKEAADGDAGLFDIQLRADTTATGITLGGPRAYSEQSPYVSGSKQARAGRAEDANGDGTYYG